MTVPLVCFILKFYMISYRNDLHASIVALNTIEYMYGSIYVWLIFYNDVMRWTHLPLFVWGITVKMRSFHVAMLVRPINVWSNGRENNRDAGDLRRQRALYCNVMTEVDKQRVLMHRHQGLNVRHGLCHIYMRYLYIYELFIAFVCFVVCSLL